MNSRIAIALVSLTAGLALSAVVFAFSETRGMVAAVIAVIDASIGLLISLIGRRSKGERDRDAYNIRSTDLERCLVGTCIALALMQSVLSIASDTNSFPLILALTGGVLPCLSFVYNWRQRRKFARFSSGEEVPYWVSKPRPLIPRPAVIGWAVVGLVLLGITSLCLPYAFRAELAADGALEYAQHETGFSCRLVGIEKSINYCFGLEGEVRYDMRGADGSSFAVVVTYPEERWGSAGTGSSWARAVDGVLNSYGYLVEGDGSRITGIEE